MMNILNFCADSINVKFKNTTLKNYIQNVKNVELQANKNLWVSLAIEKYKKNCNFRINLVWECSIGTNLDDLTVIFSLCVSKNGNPFSKNGNVADTRV